MLNSIPKIGDMVTKDGESNPIIWTIVGGDHLAYWKLEWFNNITSLTSIMHITNLAIMGNYSLYMVNQILGQSQLELNGLFRITPDDYNGIDSTCKHQWQIYHGLNHSDEFCTKCKSIRDLK